MLLMLWFQLRNKTKTSKWLAYFMIGFFVLTVTDPLPQALGQRLESQYLPLTKSSLPSHTLNDSVHVLVLGSGHTADPDLPAIDQLSISAKGRLVEGLRIHQWLPQSYLIFSGFGRHSLMSQADIMAQAAMNLGAFEARIHRLPNPTNTAEEALAYAEKLAGAQKLILVTSAIHMPRAMRIFRKAGLDPIPAPADFRIKEEPTHRGDFYSNDNFDLFYAAMHEYIGMLYERWFVKV